MEQIITTPRPVPTPPAEREADSAEKVFHDIVAAADLPVGQKKAIVMLMHGNTPERAARAAGVHRGTLYRWIKHDPAFGCLLSECRAARFADASEQLASLVGECVDTVYTAIVCGDKQMAFRLLRGLGVIAWRADTDWTAFVPSEVAGAGKAAKADAGAANLDLSREAKLA